VFSTYLYTGNWSTQTINNGIDLAGEGGIVWIKWRNIKHNLWVIPELIILKSRNWTGVNWYVSWPNNNWLNGYPTWNLNLNDWFSTTTWLKNSKINQIYITHTINQKLLNLEKLRGFLLFMSIKDV